MLKFEAFLKSKINENVDNIQSLNENRKMAIKKYLDPELISKEDFDAIVAADPTTTKKYVLWMTKQFVENKVLLEDMRNKIEEFDLFSTRGRIQEKDINKYKTYNDLVELIDEINEKGARSNRELENDYDVEVDNEDLFIAIPHTHEASRKLGLVQFAHRTKNGDDKPVDSQWCTTFKNDTHFLDYYYNQLITFYYVLVRGENMQEELAKTFKTDWKSKTRVAICCYTTPEYEKYYAIHGEYPANAVFPIDAYDAKDHKMSNTDIEKFKKIINW